MKKLATLLLCIAAFGTQAQSVQTRQKLEPIGNLKLQSGQQISDCKIGYLTYGKLNDTKKNAILFPTWFLGKAQQIATDVRPWRFIDTTHYFLIVADALANGVSSSPSNSTTQHGATFPAISITDMVEAHHQLLIQKFGIRHLHAIVGMSMGAFQAYQWAVSYPDFVDCMIPIAGSPQLTSYDILHNKAIIAAIDENPGFNHGNYTTNPSIPLAMTLLMLSTTTPANVAKTVPVASVDAKMRAAGSSPYDWNDFRTQLTACIGQDISRPFGGSLAEAAKHIKAKMLIVNNKQDHLVNPAPAIGFAELISAKLIVLDTELGHTGINYSDSTFKASVKELLKAKKPGQ